MTWIFIVEKGNIFIYFQWWLPFPHCQPPSTFINFVLNHGNVTACLMWLYGEFVFYKADE